jgi:hypothetical protein
MAKLKYFWKTAGKKNETGFVWKFGIGYFRGMALTVQFGKFGIGYFRGMALTVQFGKFYLPVCYIKS